MSFSCDCRIITLTKHPQYPVGGERSKGAGAPAKTLKLGDVVSWRDRRGRRVLRVLTAVVPPQQKPLGRAARSMKRNLVTER